MLMAFGATLLLAAGCATGRRSVSPDSRDTKSSTHSAPSTQDGADTERGIASWYGGRFHGRRTASGERFNMHELTAAHRTLPFGTKVRVVNIASGESVVVRINDRGPRSRARIIDLSFAAAKRLGLLSAGLARVELRHL